MSKWRSGGDSFFNECNHLWDWLCGNAKQGALAISERDITQHRDNSFDLTLFRDICDTNKHYARYAGKRSARIRTVEVGPTGYKVTIEADWGLPTATTEDALDLARRCVDSWKTLLTSHGVTPPFTSHGVTPPFTSHGVTPPFTSHGVTPP
jgi:hypothetical protein